MNERIKELTRQAGISILYEYDGYDGHAAVANLADIEKFAELIVKECAEIANQYYKGAKHGPGFMICEEIKQHFGVEE